MPSEPGKSLVKTVFTETRVFVSLVRRAVLLSEELRKAFATLDKQDADIKELKAAVRALQAENKLQAARLESVAIRAVADQTGELNRRLGFLEGHASRERDRT